MVEARFCKPPIPATPEGLKKEIWIKASLLTEGIHFDESALEGFRSTDTDPSEWVYKEQSHWLFDWNPDHAHRYLPEEILLPMDTIVQVRENLDSRWLCTIEDERLVLKRDGKFVTEIRQLPRPKYYSQKTSDGVDMMRVAPKRGQDCLVLNFATFCWYWVNKHGCRFCNIVPTIKWNKDDLQISHRKYEQIMETTRAAFKEGAVCHILLTGGMLPAYEGGDREDEMVADVIRAMQEGIGKKDIPVNVIRTAPKDKDLSSIKEQKELGAYSVAYNLEVWDPLMFKYYCPGKDEVQGRDHWLRALEVATEVYGPGKVSTHFVLGTELPETLLEGVEWCSKRGIATIPLVFCPVKGAHMEGMRGPTADWYVKVTQKIGDIRLKYGVDAFEPASLPNDCPKCCMPSLIGEELRLRKIEREG